MADSPSELLSRYDLRAKKSWGQCFLGDQEILGRIAGACRIGPEDTVVELGAGLGHFTRALAATGAHVVAVERDRELVAVLERELRLPNVQLVSGNAAALDFEQVAGSAEPVVAGNLPYQLTSPILFELLDQRERVRRAVFLLQKEVAVRLSAAPGSREQGLLSVLLAAYADVELLFEVPARCFTPAPKVDSAVIRIDFCRPPRVAIRDHARFVRVVKAAFSQRRKMLPNALRSDRELVGDRDLDQVFERAGVNPRARAESLSAADFNALEIALGEG